MVTYVSLLFHATEILTCVMRTQNVSMIIILLSWPFAVVLRRCVGGRGAFISMQIVQALAVWFTHSFGKYFYNLLRFRRLELFCCNNIEDQLINHMNWGDFGENGQRIENNIISEPQHSLEMTNTINISTVQIQCAE